MKIIKFSSKGCGPCKLMDRTLEVIKKDMPHVNVDYIDVNENEELTKGYSIRRLPTLVFLNSDGDEVGRVSGYLTPEDLSKEINKYEIN